MIQIKQSDSNLIRKEESYITFFSFEFITEAEEEGEYGRGGEGFACTVSLSPVEFTECQ